MMKPSEQCKKAGLKNLNELVERSGESVQTLNNWYKNKPKLFRLVLMGAALEKLKDNLEGFDSGK
ncbi:MAG: hypothetical protein OXE99_00150 [Cellvibrionales bacterium]|nr:hypothetical protein [Cellvibrionales bacterium]